MRKLARAHSGALMGVDAVVVEVEVDMSDRPSLLQRRRPARGRGQGEQGPRHLRAEERWLRPSRRSGSPSTSPRRTSARRAPPSSSPSRWPRWRPAACWSRRRSGRWVMGGELSLDGVGEADPRACFRWPSPLVTGASKACWCPRQTRPRRPSSIASTSIRSPTSREAVAHVKGEAPIPPFTGGSSPEQEGPPSSWTCPRCAARARSRRRSSSPRPGATTPCSAARPGSGKTMLARRLPGPPAAHVLRRGAGGDEDLLGAAGCWPARDRC